jgi:predicted CXXCH cytochrome family protein
MPDVPGPRAPLLAVVAALAAACAAARPPTADAAAPPPRADAVVPRADATVPRADADAASAAPVPRPGEAPCLSCHRGLLERLSTGKLHGPFAGGDCSVCHVGHDGPPPHLRRADASLCLECHVGARKARARGRSHHAPFETGRCWSCHDPHGAPREHLLARDGNDLCLSCHASVRARLADPVVKVHAAVKDGACRDCHAGHGSAAPALLHDDVPALCVTCHADGGEPMRAAHGGYAVAGARCTACHDPHASTRARLVAEHAHPPFADGECRTCHVAPGDEVAGPAGTRSDLAKACDGCHELAAQAASARGPHAPVKDGRCFGCHAPHASPREHLLVASAPALCAGCHDLRSATSGAAHAQVEAGAPCARCHDPHAPAPKVKAKAGPRGAAAVHGR